MRQLICHQFFNHINFIVYNYIFTKIYLKLKDRAKAKIECTVIPKIFPFYLLFLSKMRLIEQRI